MLIVVLGMDNLARMKDSDPLDAQFRQYAGNMYGLDRPLRDVDLVIAYEEDERVIADFAKRKDIGGLMQWLERGRQIRPGDCVPPSKLRTERPV